MRLNPANKTFEKKLNTVAQNLTPKKQWLVLSGIDGFRFSNL